MFMFYFFLYFLAIFSNNNDAEIPALMELDHAIFKSTLEILQDETSNVCNYKIILLKQLYDVLEDLKNKYKNLEGSVTNPKIYLGESKTKVVLLEQSIVFLKYDEICDMIARLGKNSKFTLEDFLIMQKYDLKREEEFNKYESDDLETKKALKTVLKIICKKFIEGAEQKCGAKNYNTEACRKTAFKNISKLISQQKDDESLKIFGLDENNMNPINFYNDDASSLNIIACKKIQDSYKSIKNRLFLFCCQSYQNYAFIIIFVIFLCILYCK